jgi:hypothetical protein
MFNGLRECGEIASDPRGGPWMMCAEPLLDKNDIDDGRCDAFNVGRRDTFGPQQQPREWLVLKMHGFGGVGDLDRCRCGSCSGGRVEGEIAVRE